MLVASVWTWFCSWAAAPLNILVLLTGVFLILLVLIQRGKGGGLAGAFGGVGGSSPFGSRAGDTFTRITIGVAAVWILLIMLQVKVVQSSGNYADLAPTTPAKTSSPPGRGPSASAVRPISVWTGCEVGVLLSMTGYGEARYQSDALTLAIELRALNNRYLKVSLRAAEPYNLLEPEFEKVIRRTVRRGTVQVHLRCERQLLAQDFRINVTALRSYIGQLRGAGRRAGPARAGRVVAGAGAGPARRGAGAGPPRRPSRRNGRCWSACWKRRWAGCRPCARKRAAAMAQELLQHRDQIAAHLERIRQRMPGVAGAYRDRLHERVRALLSELDVKIDRSDLIKEVSIFAERSDIAEEVVRLASHLDQFQEIMNEPESPAASWSS